LARDRAIGGALVAGAAIGIIIYGLLMFAFGATVARYTLEITAFIGVVAILAILGWIGYVMATTPPPVPLEPEPAPTTPSSTAPKEQPASPEKKP
jgi:predicted DNA-binding transcriptional regulator